MWMSIDVSTRVLFPRLLFLLFRIFNLSPAQARRTRAIWGGTASVTSLWAWTLIMEPVWCGHGRAVGNGGDPRLVPHCLSLFICFSLSWWEDLRNGEVALMKCGWWSQVLMMCGMMQTLKTDEHCSRIWTVGLARHTSPHVVLFEYIGLLRVSFCLTISCPTSHASTLPVKNVWSLRLCSDLTFF